jgi:copper-containing nitrite reductase
MYRYRVLLAKSFRFTTVFNVISKGNNYGASVRLNSTQPKPQIDNKSALRYKTGIPIYLVGITTAIIAYFFGKSDFYKTYASSSSKQDDSGNRKAKITPSKGGKTVPIIQTNSQSNNVRFESPTTNVPHDDVIDLNTIEHMPVETAVLSTAPNVPAPITRDHAVILKVNLRTTTKTIQLTNMYKYDVWTFNDSVPGPFIRARVGDIVELSLNNLDETGNPHNIDCHAFEGPGGGAALTTCDENQTKTARFRLLYPGLFIYHCAAAPVPVHIANGMYGMMYVQAEDETLPPVDKEFYIMQSEFYHEPPEKLENGKLSDKVEFSYPRGLDETANVMVFNGKESALTRDNPLKCSTGNNIRIFFGNAGPNLISSFHILGGVFEKVYRDGDVLSPPGRFIQTTMVPPGGAVIVDMKMLVPGTYTIIDHAIFRLDKGLVGYLNVSGKQRPDISASAQPPAPCIGCKLHP